MHRNYLLAEQSRHFQLSVPGCIISYTGNQCVDLLQKNGSMDNYKITYRQMSEQMDGQVNRSSHDRMVK